MGMFNTGKNLHLEKAPSLEYRWTNVNGPVVLTQDGVVINGTTVFALCEDIIHLKLIDAEVTFQNNTYTSDFEKPQDIAISDLESDRIKIKLNKGSSLYFNSVKAELTNSNELTYERTLKEFFTDALGDVELAHDTKVNITIRGADGFVTATTMFGENYGEDINIYTENNQYRQSVLKIPYYYIHDNVAYYLRQYQYKNNENNRRVWTPTFALPDGDLTDDEKNALIEEQVLANIQKGELYFTGLTEDAYHKVTELVLSYQPFSNQDSLKVEDLFRGRLNESESVVARNEYTYAVSASKDADSNIIPPADVTVNLGDSR